MWPPQENKIKALRDTGFRQDLINSVLVMGMGQATIPLKRQLMFEKLDGSLMGGGPCDHQTEKIPMGMGQHWKTRSFIIAPTVKLLLVMGIYQLHKHGSCMARRGNLARIRGMQRACVVREVVCR